MPGDTLAGDLKGELEAHGFRVAAARRLPHAAAANALSEDTVEQLAMGEIDGVILMSPRTATIYAALMRKHGLAAVARGLAHFCLSEAMARRLSRWAPSRAEIAEAPRLEEVLALIDEAAAQSGD